MLPKDLMADLESGDRTSEHLEVKESQTNTITIEQLQGLQMLQYGQGTLSGTSSGPLGGIIRW